MALSAPTLQFLPPDLSAALARFGQMTQADAMVIVIQHAGGALTTIALPDLTPEELEHLCLQAARLGRERQALDTDLPHGSV